MKKTSGSLPAGKLPLEFLEKLLKSLPRNNPDVIVGPGIGSDAAVVNFNGTKLVFKTDPITFLSQDIFSYLITVNSNDIACMGGTPKYLLVTVLLPEDIKQDDIEGLFSNLKNACMSMNITLIGGHTEITRGIDRPLASGFMIGTLNREPIGSTGAKPGDAILISKSIPLEAVSILARLIPERLDLDDDTLGKARNLIFDPGISVVKEAQIAAENGATALHDPTEGGLATALTELANASNCGVEVDMSLIPIDPIAKKTFSSLRINPLGAISSGSLLACCRPEKAEAIIEAWRSAGISGAVIGKMIETGIMLVENGISSPMPGFRRDELARFFDDQKIK